MVRHTHSLHQSMMQLLVLILMSSLSTGGRERVRLLGRCQTGKNILQPLPSDHIVPCPSDGEARVLESLFTTSFPAAMVASRISRLCRATSISRRRRPTVQSLPGSSSVHFLTASSMVLDIPVPLQLPRLEASQQSTLAASRLLTMGQS
jgi:hypothetical protein